MPVPPVFHANAGGDPGPYARTHPVHPDYRELGDGSGSIRSDAPLSRSGGRLLGRTPSPAEAGEGGGEGVEKKSDDRIYCRALRTVLAML